MPNINLLNVRPNYAKLDAVDDLERFLDDNQETMPPNLYNELVGIYESLDDSVSELESQLEEAKDDIQKLEKEIEERE